VIAQAIEMAKSTDHAAIIKALQTGTFKGVRGEFKFSEKPGITFQQWVDIPYVTYQITAVDQPLAKTVLVQAPGQPIDVSKLQQPAN
jgi:ABC-type branched-subunit amino acid transport system substrate-binding protein